VHKSSFGVAQLQLDPPGYEEGSEAHKVLSLHHKIVRPLLAERSGRLVLSLRHPQPPVGIPLTLGV